MTKHVKALLLGAALVASSTGTFGAFAQSASSTSGQEAQAPAITGSVLVPQGAALYLDMAKVSLQEAVAAAQQATGLSSSPSSVALEVENGYLVWEVTIGHQDVIVDAGDGTVLQTLQADVEDDDEGMETEGAEYEDAEHEGAENEYADHEGDDD